MLLTDRGAGAGPWSSGGGGTSGEEVKGLIGGSFGGLSFGLQTFEAFIQYQESTDFVKAMESLRGMKLMLKGDDGKALACNIKVRSSQRY